MDNEMFTNQTTENATVSSTPNEILSEKEPSDISLPKAQTAEEMFNNKPVPNNYKKPRIIIAIVTFVVSLAFLVSGFVELALYLRPYRTNNYSSNYSGSNSDNYGGSSSGSNSQFSTAGNVYVGSNTININGTSYTTYSFTPTTSGTYSFTTLGTIDTIGKLYRSNTLLKENDDALSSRNFYIEQYLYSGTTYYISVMAYSSGSYMTTLSITKE